MRQPDTHHPADGPALPDGAVLQRSQDGWLLELHDASGPAEAAIAAALAEVAAAGGGLLHLWVRGAGGADIAAAAVDAGMQLGREVLQMRRSLPVGRPWSLDVRPFVVGQDEVAWLGVNNRAFAWHPEQADMTLDQLRSKESEPWFDAAGFLVHEEAGRLLGFCWTKVHDHEEPPLGEIYVIAVDPAAHGRGLGRQLVLAGLDHLHGRGLTVGMLYVEADNVAAVELYRDLGFDVHTSDRRFDLQVPGR
jgi:mycothiol synthase